MLKLAFIGCGNNGMSHAGILEKNPAVELTAAVDISNERLNIIKELAPDIHCYTDYHEMLRKEEIDAVCVSTPHVFHYEQVMAALNKGCHVLLEKPIALNEQHCQEIVKTAKEKRLILQVGFECRKSALYMRVKEIIDSGEIGELNAMSFLHYRSAWMKEWYCQRKMGGESIAVIETCHYIDLMRFWSGDEVEWVFATTAARNLRSEYEYPDTSFCQFGFRKGMVASIMDSHAVSADRFKSTGMNSGKSYAIKEGEYMDPVYGHRFEYTIIGTKGTLLVNMFAKTISVITEGYKSESGRPQLGLKRVEDYNKQSLHDLVHNYAGLDNLFIDSIQHNKPAVFSPEDALETHKVVFAVEASEKTNEKVKLL